MIKGAQKRMIVVKTTESKIFEEAYFVLRREAEGVSQGDMVGEANRIIEECGGKKPKKSRWLRDKIAHAALFLGSGAIGGGIVGIIAWLL